MLPFIEKIKGSPIWKKVRGIILFLVIIAVTQILWKVWSNKLDYFPIHGVVMKFYAIVINGVLYCSSWAVHLLVGFDTIVKYPVLWLSEKWGIEITLTCSGLKQMVQFTLLMLIYPGPWKHKSWYIIFGITVIHLVNVMRIIVLSFMMKHDSAYINFTHNYVVSIMFFIVFFSLWVIWEEKFNLKRGKVHEGKP